jgi:type II restriction/modification system DNA methylase subunit YeeA
VAGITLPAFVHKWTASKRSERSGSQEHFIDLCQLLGEPTPNTDPTGESYAFEKGVVQTTGGDGFADVWKRGHFAWEYKGKHKDLKAAYQQLLRYAEDLENPPLLIVCDLDRFEVHTHFTATAKQVYAFNLMDLQVGTPTPTCPLPPLDVLRAAFRHPATLRPQQTPAQVTEQAAAEFARLAESLRDRGFDPERSAHFLMRLLFCLFAEDIGLLPAGLFGRIVAATQGRPTDFTARLQQLFGAMATGGFFGADDIAYFNGGLFVDDEALDLTRDDLEVLHRAAQLNWASIEPAIFGTLFERSLDPSKRAQLGAHYTSREDILLIVEPVLMEPLRKRWSAVQREAEELAARRDQVTGAARTRAQQALERLLRAFAAEVARVRVLDPACGSGNFLYVALKRLLDLEKEVVTFAVTHGMTAFFPEVGPEQLYGIEINPYAHELAQIVVWIGYIQWLHDNGFGIPSSPILKPLRNIEQRDAILTTGPNGDLSEPSWPDADVIIGNPPFLGGKLLRRNLGDEYVDAIFRLYDGRVPREADLVTYWFERARELIAAGQVQRVGLLATQGIRGGANRRVLDRIKETGDIFMAWSDRNWVLDGAAVHVSLVGFDSGAETVRTLNGELVLAINSNLTGALDLTRARRLRENLGWSFMGDTKGGAFDIPEDVARKFLDAPLNPNGRPNSDVVRPWVNGLDITRRPRNVWIVDFGTRMTEREAALYEAPFAHVEQHVRAKRQENNRAAYRERWWLHVEPRPAMREVLASLERYIGTPNVTKHRLFVWLQHPTLPDHQLIVIARSDDYCLGVLHSRAHELWARAMGTQLREMESGFRYTPTTTFETFPFPWQLGTEPVGDRRVQAIAEAAAELSTRRDAWLNPEGADETQLAKRTLTGLYNESPTWLVLSHGTLDQAVFDAYGWPTNIGDGEILERLLALNFDREPA